MDASDKDQASHDHRYVWFAVGLALVVLAFAAVSITVVVSTGP
jgi:heme exporter protein D